MNRNRLQFTLKDLGMAILIVVASSFIIWDWWLHDKAYEECIAFFPAAYCVVMVTK